MAKENVFLGIVNNIPDSFISNEKLYLSKHEWLYDRYCFGYIGNDNIYYHIDTEILQKRLFSVNDLFKSTNISEETWYTICDLFIQAYSLHRAYTVYYYGTGGISNDDECRILKHDNKKCLDIIKNDLGLVLNKIWDVAINI